MLVLCRACRKLDNWRGLLEYLAAAVQGEWLWVATYANAIDNGVRNLDLASMPYVEPLHATLFGWSFRT